MNYSEPKMSWIELFKESVKVVDKLENEEDWLLVVKNKRGKIVGCKSHKRHLWGGKTFRRNKTWLEEFWEEREEENRIAREHQKRQEHELLKTYFDHTAFWDFDTYYRKYYDHDYDGQYYDLSVTLFLMNFTDIGEYQERLPHHWVRDDWGVLVLSEVEHRRYVIEHLFSNCDTV